jgi:hypothetical protein
MEIKNISAADLGKKRDRSANERSQYRDIKKNGSAHAEDRLGRDRVEISEAARAFHRDEDEIKVSKELLNNLPSTRAHVIYEALAKLKAGHYSSEKIIAEASAKLIESGELDDILSA